MFTGIVEEIGTLESIKGHQMTFRAGKLIKGLEIGGSMAVNGVCLTVVRFDNSTFTIEIMPETLRRSNLGGLVAGDRVNLETPLTMNKPLGGHFVQGHIDDTGRIDSIQKVSGATIITIAPPENIMRYIAYKGFVAIDGISLTVVEKNLHAFSVSIVGHSLDNTILGYRKVRDVVNIEVDILAKYVENLVSAGSDRITVQYLAEHGFMTD